MSQGIVRPFAHLHCHSHYSLLDGAAPIGKLIQRAKDHGMNSLAITDHGNLHGALEFYRKANEAGINPILGYEAYIAPGSRRDKSGGSVRESSYHLTLLAKNAQGFRNLIKLASLAFLEGFHRKPRIDRECLEDHSEGLICLSGCASGELSRTLARRLTPDFPWDESLEIARWFHRVFGDRYFIEIQNNGAEVQRIALEGSLEVANRLGIPLVATSDAHYVDPQDAEAQDVLLCINTGRFRAETNRMKMDGNQYYLRSPNDMYMAFPGLEDAVARSQEIADSVDIKLDLYKRHFPTYSLPKETSADDYLRELCTKGLLERYRGNEELCPDGELAPIVVERLERELGVIKQLGFSNYFLIVWDFVRQARDLGIPATARGSGVGAIVSFGLHLSHVCPIKYDLLFERFLDPSRKEAPDIDIDFCRARRGEIIRYVKEKYGESNVAQIGTFGTLAARAAIRDVGRALGFPIARVNEIAQMVPEELGISLEKAYDKSADLKAACQGDPSVRELFELASKIEGLARNVGTHAAAVVIADKPLTEYVPLGRVTGKTDIITQWSMSDVEAAGLLKMDFLGLRNLTILSKAVDLIQQTTGKTLDPYSFPLDDAKTFGLLSRGETKGIFQLESGGIRDLLQRMRPDSFHDIIATNALYRPGPLEGGMVDDYVAVKNGRKKAEYKHPVLKEILEETHGVMVYQEQVMRILNRLGGIELANAYTCIKAISKKKESIINAFHEQFMQGATDKGLTKKESQDLWELIQKFAGYGFNKSHSTAYALIAYMTAFMKANYPIEFMAALLTSDIDGRNFKRKDSLVEHLEDCQRMGIEVLPPNVNESDIDFTVRDGKILFGLSAIKGCGGGAASSVVENRRAHGKYKDIFDLCERAEGLSSSRSTLETLIKAGALDCFGAKRSQSNAMLDRAMQHASSAAADKRSGQKSLFAMFEEPEDVSVAVSMPDIPEWEEREKLAREKEVLGFYLTSHPLTEFQDKIAEYCSFRSSQLQDVKERTEVWIGGMISSIKISHVKKARNEDEPTKYANFDLEDVDGVVRCIMWPNEYASSAAAITGEAVVAARAIVDRRGGGDEINLIVKEIVPVAQLESRCARRVTIRVDEKRHGPTRLKQVRELARIHSGNCPLQLLLDLEDGQQVVIESQSVRVSNDAAFRERIDDLLSKGHFEVMTQPLRTP
jgi:DNA polymerase III subunit alpha